MGVSGPRNPLFQEMGIRAPVWGRGNPNTWEIGGMFGYDGFSGFQQAAYVCNPGVEGGGGRTGPVHCMIDFASSLFLSHVSQRAPEGPPSDDPPNNGLRVSVCRFSSLRPMKQLFGALF